MRRQDKLEVWGFNNIEFDDKLCQANGLMIHSDGDLLPLIRTSADGSNLYEEQPKGYSYSLGEIAAANRIIKTGTENNAAKLWQDGEYKQVIYCGRKDVAITKRIFKLFEQGRLIDPNTMQQLQMIRAVC